MRFELTIDGLQVVGKRGQTILQVAKANGITIPTLCYHPRLEVTGACRICVVDIGRPDRLEAACTMPITHGMIVNTNTERVLRARRMNLELLLANHTIDCLTCEQNGNCALQDLAYDLGIERDTIGFEVHDRGISIDRSSPAIEYDPNKCVLCGRCVSACNDIQHHGILNYQFRGHQTTLIAGLAQPFMESGCVFCGECVQVCPTGAIIEQMARFKGQWWQLDKVTTVCPYCGVGCSIEVYTKGAEIVKIRGDEEGITNRGSLCVKGRFGFDYVHSKERITKPLIRRNSEWIEVGWGEALNYVAAKFIEIKRQSGGSALAGLSSAKCTNEENYLFQKLMRTSFGTNNVDHCARLCHASTVAGLGQAFGSGAMTNSISEILQADAIFVIGSNTTENHPIIGMYVKQAVHDHNAQLIVADPRQIELTNDATIWLRHHSGTDVALLNGMMNVIISEDLQDSKFIDDRCENYAIFQHVISRYSPDLTERITGVPTKNIQEAARLITSVDKACFIFSMGITQHTTGVANVLSIANLAMLTGNIGRKSTGVYPLRGQNNVQGACDMGALPNVYPGYQSVTNPSIRAIFESAWGIGLDTKPGLTVVEMIHAAMKGNIRGMYIMGENPLLSDPNLNYVKSALQKLEFLVVQDIFMSETAELADVILPSSTSFEKHGTFTNTSRRIQRVVAAIPPLRHTQPDWQIICQLSTKMGYPMNYTSPREIMKEIAELTPIYSGVDYTRLGQKGLQWPCPSQEHPGTPYMHKERFTRGRGWFSPVEYKPPAEVPNNNYPFLLTTGRILSHFQTGVQSRRAIALNKLAPTAFLEIHPQDAAQLNIHTEDWVNVISRRGKLQIKAAVTDRVKKGTVFIPFHFKEAAANLLTNDALDPIAKIPEYKVAAVKLLKIECSKRARGDVF
ncbi:MAG: formate dehydrogenase subunit alpha [Candidatus Bathyarchaeota archaeon]|nr:formate dehydrogenase subunit alpha [Candidatus Bathyarchaeota archaeon]